MAYQCAVCGDPTERGTLMFINGRWVAVALCSKDKGALRPFIGPDTHVIDAAKPN